MFDKENQLNPSKAYVMVSSLQFFLYVHKVKCQHNSMFVEKIINAICSDKFNDDMIKSNFV